MSSLTPVTYRLLATDSLMSIIINLSAEQIWQGLIHVSADSAITKQKGFINYRGNSSTRKTQIIHVFGYLRQFISSDVWNNTILEICCQLFGSFNNLLPSTELWGVLCPLFVNLERKNECGWWDCVCVCGGGGVEIQTRRYVDRQTDETFKLFITHTHTHTHTYTHQ